MPGPTNFHPHPGFGRGVAARLRAGNPTNFHPHPVIGRGVTARLRAGITSCPLMRLGLPLRPGAHHGARHKATSSTAEGAKNAENGKGD